METKDIAIIVLAMLVVLLVGFLLGQRRKGSAISPADVSQLKQLAKQNTPTRVIGLKMGRTEDAVRAKASETDVSLKPTNQSPYNRRKP